MDIMLDLETFSTAPNAAIVQIGAFQFDPASDAVGAKFTCNVNLASSLLLGLHVDPKTVAWWQTQESAHLLTDAVPLGDALQAFSSWYNSLTPASPKVWGHGASFDIPILDSSYRALKREVPWHYRAPRDTRTLFDLAERKGWVKPVETPAHHAQTDAMQQAVQVQAAMRVVLA